MPPEPTLVTVLRHGQTAGRAHVFRGAQDDPLSDAGRAAMAAALTRLDAPPCDRIAASPRTRCREAAAHHAQTRGVPLTLLEGFREMAFGAWEGLTPDEAALRDPELYARFRDHACAAPGGESLAGLRARVATAWQDWLADADGGHRLLVTHAGVMRALLMDLIGLPEGHVWRIALPECGHFRISHLAGHAPVLLHLNACAA
ncbi:MAG: histidine phosphatase family protein [Betaproteobacteria bacterium]|nr:histidine phosphatase family protein [Betaproteobacteria bacterium]